MTGMSVEVKWCGSSSPGKTRAFPGPQCSWPGLQGCPLSQARWKGRSKDSPAVPQLTSQVSCRTQEAGVGGGYVNFARWGCGPNLSEEPWMNQPTTAASTAVMVKTSSTSSLSSNAHFPFLSPPDSGFGRGVAPGQWLRGTPLELVVKLGPNAGTATLTFKIQEATSKS